MRSQVSGLGGVRVGAACRIDLGRGRISHAAMGCRPPQHAVSLPFTHPSPVPPSSSSLVSRLAPALDWIPPAGCCGRPPPSSPALPSPAGPPSSSPSASPPPPHPPPPHSTHQPLWATPWGFWASAAGRGGALGPLPSYPGKGKGKGSHLGGVRPVRQGRWVRPRGGMLPKGPKI